MKWLLWRRFSQLTVLTIFLLGPLAGLWLIKGSLAGSMILDVIPLTDPLTLLQTIMAGHIPAATALVGMGLVLTLYLIGGGRTFCAWVCPVNIITDSGEWLRKKLGLKVWRQLAQYCGIGYWLRYWL